ncbi:helicase [Devosia pacifica]|uniref:Helicase n=1 Tax=Devosia pacifica TaxID=1335967 RepID=A0A918RV14_9HYPH|nr:ATP-dependent helicase HrpB [Devosia pacifica]GHA11524.1 helicase [Devosia pacifica]
MRMPSALPHLPIDDVLPLLRECLSNSGRAVLVAPPGAGKTTRVPLALLGEAWRADSRVIVLEPRRLAARGAARQMAQLLGETVGETVGYRVRLESRVSARTRIEVVTEGVFTRMILDDPELPGVAAVLFDEFHERSLDADLGLALALDTLALRDDLRVLVMSATLDGARIAERIDGAQVIEATGRTFPIETRYLPPEPQKPIEPQVARAVLQALEEEWGSILVFLPGQAEISRVYDALRGRVADDTDVLALFGRMATADQDAAIRSSPAGRRKVVLATSIAETSLTIPDIRVVVDSGLARRPLFDPATGLTRLVTRKVSRASAEQRRGRAGRTEPGVCYRLWPEGQTAGLQPFDPPEILQADLTGIVLQLASIGVRDPNALSFLDLPPASAWQEAEALLAALDALDSASQITARGREMARLPMHPRLAHMVLGAREDNDVRTAATLGALLTEPGAGGNDVDIGVRLEVLARDNSPRAKSTRQLAEQWCRLAGAVPGSGLDPGAAGYHLARAYPDRVAQSAGAKGRFRLANGRAASLEPTHALANEAFIVVTDLGGEASRSRIHSAARLNLEEIETLFSHRIKQERRLHFDKAAAAIRVRNVRTLGALVLSETTEAPKPEDQVGQALAAAIAEIGIQRLPWSRNQFALRDRASFLARELGAPWPDLSDAALADNGADWIVAHIGTSSKLSDITADMLESALFELLPWALRQQLDTMLPSHFDAPSGSRLPIDYANENGPTLQARPQELFGLDHHPTIADGRIGLLVVLLSPAQRPIQSTRDLPGFWRGSWREVARELKGRYPRHSWPDDPLSAEATSRAKPRGR